MNDLETFKHVEAIIRSSRSDGPEALMPVPMWLLVDIAEVISDRWEEL